MPDPQPATYRPSKGDDPQAEASLKRVLANLALDEPETDHPETPKTDRTIALEAEMGAPVGTEEYGKAFAAEFDAMNAASDRARAGRTPPTPDSMRGPEVVYEDSDRLGGEMGEEAEAAELAALKAQGDALQEEAEQGRIDADLAELTKNPPPPPEALEAPTDVPEAPTDVPEERLGESPAEERYPGENAKREVASAAEKAIAADTARKEDAFSDAAFEDVPEDFTPGTLPAKTLQGPHRENQFTQDMPLETGQPGPTGGGGRALALQEVDRGYINQDLTPKAAAIDSAAGKAVAKHTPNRWQGRGGYNFTLIPGDKAKGTEVSILVEAPIGRAGSSMAEGTKVVITPEMTGRGGKHLFTEILKERAENKHIKEYGKSWSGGPSRPPPGGGEQKVTDEMLEEGFTGQGTRTEPDGPTYEGEWEDGKSNGQGTHTWPSGAVYVGGHKDGQRSGQGTYTWPSGTTYVGEWRDNTRNGQGIYTDSDGAIKEGLWANGKFVGDKGEPVAAPPRDNYDGGDPTPDEIKGVVSDLSPEVRASKQQFILNEADRGVQQANARVQQAAASLEEAKQITESTGDTSAQEEAEQALNMEKAALEEAVSAYSKLMSPEHAARMDSSAPRPVDADRGFLSPGLGGR